MGQEIVKKVLTDDLPFCSYAHSGVHGCPRGVAERDDSNGEFQWGNKAVYRLTVAEAWWGGDTGC